MATPGTPAYSFQDVYRRFSTGGYYTRKDFPLQGARPDHHQASGKPCYFLVPVYRLFSVSHDVDRNSPLVEQYQSVPAFQKDRFSEQISVGVNELDAYFERMPYLRAVQTSDLEDLVRHYQEECSPSKPKEMAAAAHRYALTMEDSQARYLLEMMARELSK